MTIVGINLPETKEGMKLNDGGCAVIKEGALYAVAEERVSREKHAGGYKESLRYCLDATSTMPEDVDLFVVSSCCEKARESSNVEINGVPREKILVCPSHHLSHAVGAFSLSPFKKSLIMVIDNEGNIVDEDENSKQPFHKRQMEHMSFYVGDEDGIRLAETDEVPENRIGVGDAYRYFTHYLGFPSYVYAGKTMGLAAYGDRDAYKNKKIFRLTEGHICCDIENNYFDCISSLKSFFKIMDVHCGPRTPIDPITQEHADLARWIQRETEDILVDKINYLVDKTGIRTLCIAGGVGLNSVANAEILKRSGITEIFILPAAGDTGQCVGNALYGLWQQTGKFPFIPLKDAYLGRNYAQDEIEKAIRSLQNDSNYEVFSFANEEEQMRMEASLLWENKYVGHFNGRSEFGPRSLGNRSILANPCSPNAKDDLNKTVKFRENFRPFAPIVLAEKAKKYFEIDRELPYMLVVVDVKYQSKLPAITHVDGTARVQTVNDSQNKKMCCLLREFEKLSGVPVLLNTSFNTSGEPIVETPQDAVNCFTSTALHALSIGNYLIVKKNINYPVDAYIQFVTSLGANLAN